ncbi:hypothetical protein K431DRAFT_335186 [Polychaeton citri CBS 116435]|uniref:HRDC domain-containing protein n=1 Tax=Polychaeton citri CBS 116435 TaxID=1314669 RepID=A0A9P4ULE9_9PEZI|nr:hypothetical protein K431DRAFT_335186 [Polychaeton citri CBS 116435]
MDDFNTLQQSIQSSLVATTRSASALASEDLSFHRSLDPSIGSKLDRQNARLITLAQGLLASATAGSESIRKQPRLSDIESVEDNWKAVVDVVDSLLERADTALDEFTGAVKRLTPTREGLHQTPNAKPLPRTSSKPAAAFRNQDIPKPQLLFDVVPNNFESEPFKPLLLTKPHASNALETTPSRHGGDDRRPQYSHPYQLEIEQYQYPASVHTYSEPVIFHAFEETTATLVDTEEQMEEMLEELKKAKEIAIDLEHHDHRSYIGIVSLMQISTRERDWIVDTLKPWRRKLQRLNQVFADPAILKVLHGAYMDVVWLQRDLGLYLVGLFDTHFACRALGYSGASLAFLLKKFADVDAQKQYQTADWRIRPLPQELFDYARSDTHYLLYIYDCMRNELIAKSDFSKPEHEGDKLWDVLQKSKETALQCYEHPTYDYGLGQGPAGWYKMLSRTPANLTKEQFGAFRAIHRWRDQVAREQDDSVHFVMAGHNVFSIAKALPTTKAELLNIAQPLTQTIRLRADELLDVLIKARAEGENGPEMLDLLSEIEPRFWRKQAEKPQSSTFGLTQHFPKRAAAPLAKEIVTDLPLRSSASSFWGRAFPIADSRSTHDVSSSANLALAMPLPPLAVETFRNGDEPITATPPKITQEQAVTPAGQSKESRTDDDDVFVLKQMGRKRKHTELNDGLATQEDTLSIEPDEATQRMEKAERRRARKAARRAAQEPSTNSNSATPRDEDEEQPFDYENAPNMLQLPRLSREEMKKKSKKQVNPYTKALDTRTGLPRTQKEKAGKTMTFKE